MMEKVSLITGAAVPLLRENVDTDMIIRIERMTGTTRASMGQWALESLRFHPDGSVDTACVLNRKAFERAPILLAGANFGCGSSREAAVWALMGAGLRCVIAPSFSEIFAGNCFQNGLLPVVLPDSALQELARLCADAAPVTVDLKRQIVQAPGGVVFGFAIDQRRRAALLGGLDEIAQTMLAVDDIAAFQRRDRLDRPWIWREQS
jgi:3-isopropylmalate/(R)-2-methylmalate dehydratase small subunit